VKALGGSVISITPHIAMEAKMATHTLDHDRTTQWKVNQDNDTWTLAANTQLYVSGKPAVVIDSGFDNNTLNINGRILNTGADAYAIMYQANNTTINIGAKGEIDAMAGVYGGGLNTTVTNKGEIDATYYGIYSNDAAHVENSGEIQGAMAVVLGGNSAPTANTAGGQKTTEFHNVLINHKDGEILGGGSGVYFAGVGQQKIVNDGLIAGGEIAVGNSSGTLHLVNRGIIDGDVQFDSGNDFLDTRRGTINGEVRGDSGNDTYVTSKAYVDIVEDTSGGYDTVKSDANHTLATNVEKLLLLGKGDIDGKGNAGDNFMRGNAGDNHLKGLAGSDILGGGKGSDILTGGADTDAFVFYKGDGKDVITDFQHGTDRITLFNFNGTDDFNAVSNHMADHGKDLWITYGDDTLILKGVHEVDLDTNDFNFPL
jgi:hypothetical protein